MEITTTDAVVETLMVMASPTTHRRVVIRQKVRLSVATSVVQLNAAAKCVPIPLVRILLKISVAVTLVTVGVVGTQMMCGIGIDHQHITVLVVSVDVILQLQQVAPEKKMALK